MTPMTMPLDCEEFAAKLADHLDGELPDAARVAMEAHASTCDECGRLLSDLGALRVSAGALPLLEPSRDLWAGIAERIHARVLPLEAPHGGRVAEVRRAWRHPLLAAAALVLVTVGVTHLWTRRSYEVPAPASSARQIAVAPALVPPATGTDTVTDATAGIASSVRSAGVRGARPARAGQRVAPSSTGSQAISRPSAVLVSRAASTDGLVGREVNPVYDREIVTLRAIVRERRWQLDPKTVAVLEQSIAVIDSAIAQSRAALARDPSSGFLATQLDHSLEKKVELLRTAALLPART